MAKEITFINSNIHSGNRWLISPAIGFVELGYKVNWLGLQMGGFDLLYPGFKEQTPTSIPGIKFIPEYTEQDAIDLSRSSDLVLFSLNHERYGTIGIHKWAEILNKELPSKFLVFSGLDSASGGRAQDELELFNCKHYIKREAYHNDTVPFVGMSTHKELYRNRKTKSIPISCLFGGLNGTPIKGWHRDLIAKAVSTIPDSLVTTSNKFNHNDYMNLIASSKISVSTWGVGYICYRDFEILSCDTILAIKRVPMPYFDDFKDMESIIFYTTPDELVSKSLEVLEDKELYTSMLEEQKIIVAKHHMPIHRAKQLLELIHEG